MIRTTRAQRIALKRLFDRGPIFASGSADSTLSKMGWHFDHDPDKLTHNAPDACWWVSPIGFKIVADSADIVRTLGLDRALSYREFRRRAVPYGDGSLVIGWHGMTVGIEPDGYTHS